MAKTQVPLSTKIALGCMTFVLLLLIVRSIVNFSIPIFLFSMPLFAAYILALVAAYKNKHWAWLGYILIFGILSIVVSLNLYYSYDGHNRYISINIIDLANYIFELVAGFGYYSIWIIDLLLPLIFLPLLMSASLEAAYLLSYRPQPKKCPSCQMMVREGTRFCPSCGNQFAAPAQPQQCPRCQRKVKRNEKFCSSCGYNLPSYVAPTILAQATPSTPTPQATLSATSPAATITCPTCNTINQSQDSFCGSCGKAFSPITHTQTTIQH